MGCSSSSFGTRGTRGKRGTRKDGHVSASYGLRVPALLAMAANGFVIIMTETLPAGLLPQIADGLAVSQAGAGQLVTAYAGGTVLAALPAVTLTRGFRRKPLLLAGIAGFLIANALTAVVGSYGLALVVRFVAGAFSGLLWGITPGYARRTAPPELGGRALSIAMLGAPVALAVGTPLGTFAGSLVGWRAVFGALSVISIGMLAWVALAVPDVPGTEPGDRTSVRVSAVAPGVPAVLAVVVGWMLAHNMLYTYISPLMHSLGSPAQVDVVLLAFGVSAIASIWITGVLVDRALRLLVLASLAGFGAAALAMALGGRAPAASYGAVVVWGLTFGGAATQLNTAAADAAADVDVTATLITTVWNLAILGGGLLGGALLSGLGATSLSWSALALIAAALAVAFTARRRAFPPGPRSG